MNADLQLDVALPLQQGFVRRGVSQHCGRTTRRVFFFFFFFKLFLTSECSHTLTCAHKGINAHAYTSWEQGLAGIPAKLTSGLINTVIKPFCPVFDFNSFKSNNFAFFICFCCTNSSRYNVYLPTASNLHLTPFFTLLPCFELSFKLYVLF